MQESINHANYYKKESKDEEIIFKFEEEPIAEPIAEPIEEVKIEKKISKKHRIKKKKSKFF